MKEMYCIVCPNGCRLQAEEIGGEIRVSGHGCKRGIDFARTEMTKPVRSLTTTVRTAFAGVPVLPVRTDGEIPKGLLRLAMAELNRITVRTPLACGEVVSENIAGSGCRVIVTSNILQEWREKDA